MKSLLRRSYSLRPYKSFDEILKREPPVKGIDDFISRLPFLISQKMSNCGRICLEGFGYDENTREHMKDEISEAIRYSGFRFFWGRKGKSITIRMETPKGTRALNEYERKTFEQVIRCFSREEQQKFKKNVLKVNERGDTILETTFLKEREVKGKIESYWNPYYESIVRPILAYIRVFNRDFN